jgi:hypothetical protein
MRHILLAVVLFGCDGITSTSSTPARPSSCPRDCRPDESDCSTFPYAQLPARCQEICYLGECCNLVDGAWQIMTVDCARPVPIDGGMDAAGDPGGW